ncbi:MAG: polysaccharide deacetylase [Rhodospirillaceae bacterium]|nr:polysaccharide deacetylase [Rhodospirillaceae bacterium]MBT6203282.1 polysaccharide deacetylase [Rhodospirillaceae bacterium]MBT6508926.1 polysaccharide deacetylase [Rhodospirillaceae bacterium]MBT7614377.1 polysaccharide deacetylase [Rhodospirillaceae bacterium]
MLSFDFDAETLWIGRDSANWKRPGVLSHGKYGANLGVPKILETLEDADVPATFFVPGWTAEHHTGRVEAIVERGHEIGHHSYLHEWIDPEDPEAEEEELDKGLEALKATVGVVPTGYRSPAGETSDNMVHLLSEKGFVYDSSMMDHINPYRHASGLIELPWHWSLDDAIYSLFSIRNPRPVFANSQIKEIWQDEFCEIYAWGGLFDLVMHPQVTGRPSRVAMLREFIAWMQTFPGVWFATGNQICEAWAAQEGDAA